MVASMPRRSPTRLARDGFSSSPPKRAPFATGGTPGGFYALSGLTGAILWSFPTSGRTVAAMITVGGTLLGADTDGIVYAFRSPSAPRR